MTKRVAAAVVVAVCMLAAAVVCVPAIPTEHYSNTSAAPVRRQREWTWLWRVLGPPKPEQQTLWRFQRLGGPPVLRFERTWALDAPLLAAQLCIAALLSGALLALIVRRERRRTAGHV